MSKTLGFAFFVSALALTPLSHAGTVATYIFNDTFAAQEGGVAALTPVDPLSTSGFGNSIVFGNNRTVYTFHGAASPPADQGGLQFNTTGLIAPDQYSVEMVFSFESASGWRRILDSQDRTSDSGFYVDPSNHLDVFPVAGATTGFSANVYYDVFLTVASSGAVDAYLGTSHEFSTTTSVMNVSTNTLGLFLDNTAGGGQGEWSGGNIALFRVFNNVLTPSDIATLDADPFAAGKTSVPEPASWLLLAGGAAALLAFRRRFAN
jgi:hypothetical protein